MSGRKLSVMENAAFLLAGLMLSCSGILIVVLPPAFLHYNAKRVRKIAAKRSAERLR